jgi:DNA-binding NarL/FixJ family response regulator
MPASQPDVVALDVQLEGGTRLQVLRAVRRARPGIAFVDFSNNASAPYRKRHVGRARGASSTRAAGSTSWPVPSPKRPATPSIDPSQE